LGSSSVSLSTTKALTLMDQLMSDEDTKESLTTISTTTIVESVISTDRNLEHISVFISDETKISSVTKKSKFL